MRLRTRGGFTLIELIAVIVVLAILAGVALPKVLDLGDDAKRSAADGSIGTLRATLTNIFYDHQTKGSPEGEWIDGFEDFAGLMASDQFPQGLRIEGARLIDQLGREYALIAQTSSEPARLDLVEDPTEEGGGQGGVNGSGGGDGSFAN